MTKKKPIKIILSFIFSIILLFILSFAFLIISGNTVTTANCIVSQNGAVFMVYNDRPVKLAYAKETDFDTGDKLLIIHKSSFAESYPEQAKAHLIIKLKNGTAEDVPEKIINDLNELGNKVTSAYNESAPELKIIYGENEYKALRGTYSWCFEKTNGINEAVCADSSHPLYCKEFMTGIALLSELPLEAVLSFSTPPDELSAIGWKESYWESTNAESKNIPIDKDVIYLENEPFIYEITATWKGNNNTGGTVHFSFYTTK